MASSSEYNVSSLKSACDRGQNWIANRLEKVSNCANKFSTLKTGYSKVRPSIFPKRFPAFKNENPNEIEHDEEESEKFLKNRSNRIQSVDTIDNSIRAQLNEQFKKRNSCDSGSVMRKSNGWLCNSKEKEQN